MRGREERGKREKERDGGEEEKRGRKRKKRSYVFECVVMKFIYDFMYI